jgi:hypothetical protein
MRVQMRGYEGSHPKSTPVLITGHGAQINFGDLTPYLTYGVREGDSYWWSNNFQHANNIAAISNG